MVFPNKKGKNCIYNNRLRRNIHHVRPDTTTEMHNAKINPNGLFSIPFNRFIPKRLAIRVGNIMMILTEVRVRMVVFILLLMMLE